MPRVKRAVHARKKRAKVLEQAKGYYGRKKSSYRFAKEQVEHSLVYAYRDRKAKKRTFRSLWIIRINAAARENGLSYNRFMGRRRTRSRRIGPSERFKQHRVAHRVPRVRGDGERATLAAFLLGAALAGGNAVAVRFSNRGLDPLWGAGLRFALAAAIFLGLVLALRLSFPRGRALAGALLWGLIQFAATFALMSRSFTT